MSRTRLIAGTALLLLSLAASRAEAQWHLSGEPAHSPSRTQWEQRMVRSPQTSTISSAEFDPFGDAAVATGPASRTPATARATTRPSNTMTGYRRVAAQGPVTMAPEEIGPPMGPIPQGDLMPEGVAMPNGHPMSGDVVYEHGGGPGCATCGDYGGVSCGDGCDGCPVAPACCDFNHGVIGYLVRNSYLFAGAHGFKGPVDQGRNGNFGLHEGLNFGASIGGGYEIGYQLGFQAVQSNFSGNQVDNDSQGTRRQVFFTGGLFHRAPCGGLQWGVVYDLQHDDYYSKLDLKQIRMETSLVLPWRHEIGYMGVYGIDSDSIYENARNALRFDPTDMYALFIRRQFELGGEGKLWAGVSGFGDGLLGAELRVPIGKSFAIENRFTYLIPKEGRGNGGQQEESWGLVFNLVWYPGRSAACERENCFRPLFNVADNSIFMVSQR